MIDSQCYVIILLQIISVSYEVLRVWRQIKSPGAPELIAGRKDVWLSFRAPVANNAYRLNSFHLIYY